MDRASKPGEFPLIKAPVRPCAASNTTPAEEDEVLKSNADAPSGRQPAPMGIALLIAIPATAGDLAIQAETGKFQKG
jgi:hypothetical protein